jgi:hypothetical protein
MICPNGAGLYHKKQITMFALAMDIFLYFLIVWFSLFYSYFLRYQYPSHFMFVVIVFSTGIGKVILYIMYEKAYKARLWEKRLFLA